MNSLGNYFENRMKTGAYCVTPCPGNPQQICGGTDHYSAFHAGK